MPSLSLSRRRLNDGLRPSPVDLQVPSSVEYTFVSDVAVGPDGLVYLLTREPGRVVVCDPDGWFQREFGSGVLGSDPHGITVAGSSVYVADQFAHVVRVFALEGEETSVLGHEHVGSDTGVDDSIEELFTKTASIKRGAGPFNRPTNVAVASNGDTYVSDGYGNSRVHRFSATGELVGSWGDPGPGTGEFWIVHHVAIDSRGRILVVDRGNDRIQIFEPDGTYVAQWRDLQHPSTVVPNADGTAYVAELAYAFGAGSFARGRIRQALPARISLLSADGEVLARSEGEPASNPFTFVSPHGMASDAKGSLYVADLRIPRSDPAGRPCVQRLDPH
jgi:NHL repeat